MLQDTTVLLKIGSRRKKNALTKSQHSRGTGALWLLLLVAALLWWGGKQISSYFVEPEAVFVLGGAEKRERFAADWAQQHRELPIWVSSGSPEGYAKRVFAKAGIESDHLHLDYQAIDTVTNFTTLVEELQARGIDSVYLITSQNHMRRARVVGEIVFGSRGIALKPISVPTAQETEPVEKSIRDGARALLWVATGRSGASLYRFSERFKEQN